jgi:zinc/manganese transport system permease protein
MQPIFSLNPWTDLSTMWSYPYLRHALIAGSIVAIVASVLGWVMVLRRESFLGHTLAIVSFPGAGVALALGLPPQLGYYIATLLAALVAGRRPSTRTSANPFRDATTGTVQAVALAAGLIAISASQSFIDSTTSLLFGSFLGITTTDVIVIGIVGALALSITAVMARPLILTTFDATTAEAAGLPVALLSATYVFVLALVVASTAQITGALLVFALLVMPATIAERLVTRLWVSAVVAIGVALAIVWIGIGCSFFAPVLPLGFSITSVGMVLFLAASVFALRPAAKSRVVTA